MRKLKQCAAHIKAVKKHCPEMPLNLLALNVFHIIFKS